MDPVTLVPAAGVLQAPWGWFDFLLLLTFSAHILFMNIVLGSAVFCLAAEFRRKDLDAARDLSRKMPTALALTVNAGVAPLLFLQVLHGHFFYTSAVIQGWWYLSIIGLVILAYYGLYLYDFRFDKLGGARLPVLLACVLFLLLTGFIFSSNMTLMLTPERWIAYFAQSGGAFLNYSEPTLLPRYLHFIAASVAVGGLFQAVLWRRREARGVAGAQARAGQGMRWFAWATVVQASLGVIYLMTLPNTIMLRFMGGSTLHTVALLAGLALAGTLIYLGFGGKTWPAVWTLLGTVMTMAVIRDLVRLGHLEPYPGGKIWELPEQIQYSPMIVFFVVLVAGMAVVAWMLSEAAKAKAGQGEG